MTLPVDYANATVSLDNHPDAHNETNTAVNTLTDDVAAIDGRVTTLEDVTPAYEVVTFSQSGVLTAGTGTFRWYAKGAYTIVEARASVGGNQPTGGAIVIDVNKNGTTIFTTTVNRPTIAVSTNTDVSGTPDVTSLADGDYLTVDIDAVGLTVAGSDLTVQVVLVPA